MWPVPHEVSLPPTSWKLRAAALSLAVAGAACALWLQYEGQKFKSQQLIFAERQSRFETLGSEVTSLQARADRLRAEGAAHEARIAAAGKALSGAEGSLAQVQAERDKAEAERSTSLTALAELRQAIASEQRSLERTKGQLTEAKLGLEALQSETVRAKRDHEQERARREAVASQADALELKLSEQRGALARATAELRDVAQQKLGLVAEIGRSTSRLESAREQNQKEEERASQARQELAALRQESDRRRQELESSRKEIADLAKSRPSLQAQVQTLQHQLDGLEQTARKRQDLASSHEQRLGEASLKTAELEARRAGLEQRSKDLQDLIKEQAKRLSDLKSDADRLVTENAKLQEQTKIAEAQRRDMVRLSAQYEQIVNQNADVERRLIARVGELARLTSAVETTQQKASVEGVVSTR